MIRPITCLAALLACGSGLYLYQEKHRVQLLDHQIEQTIHQADQLREQTRMLHAEWTLLNDPTRLQQLASQFLHLQTVSPSQFTDMAHLDSRLPPVTPQPTVPATPENTTDVPVAQAEPAAPVDAAKKEAVAAAQDRPAGSDAAAKPAEVRVAQDKPAETEHVATDKPRAKPVDRVRVAQAAPEHAGPPHLPAPRPWHPAVTPHPDAQIREVHYEPHWQARPELRWQPPRGAMASPPYAREAPPPPRPYAGSMLGMAHDTPRVPAPQPVTPRSVQQMFPMSNGGG